MNEETPVPVSPLNSKPQELNRVTIYAQIAHQQANEQPRGIPLSYSELLHSDQESYSRRMRATPEWEPLDCGWIHPTDVGLFVIENIEGKRFSVNPTADELALVMDRVIEIAYASSLEDTWPCPPRAFFFSFIERAADLRIRCRGGEAQFRITVIPR